MHSTRGRPFFIVGSPRSGTTLLRFILSSHPRLYIPEETGFIPHLVQAEDIGTRLNPNEVEAILDRIGKLNYLWENIVENPREFYDELPEPTLTCMLEGLYRKIVVEHGAIRWGDKTPLYVRYIPLLSQLFPKGQFIHIIRDGRDTTLSAQRKWGLEAHWYMDNYYLLKNWVTNVSTGRREGEILGHSVYFEMKYENLVRQPEKSVRQICFFLGETFHPGMLDHTALASKVGPGPNDHTEVMKPITTASIARWRDEMSAFDLKMADRIAGPLLERLGYERPAMPPLTGMEKMRFISLSVKYQFSETLRRILYASGLLTLNRTMRRR